MSLLLTPGAVELSSLYRFWRAPETLGAVDLDALVARADRAMYAAKAAGRDQVVAWSDLGADGKIAPGMGTRRVA